MPLYNLISMTAHVYVSLKKSVLDPQGKTIQGALNKMGYKGLESVRQGKYFELSLSGGLTREEASAEVERIAREVLTNPVIEEFRFSSRTEQCGANTACGQHTLDIAPATVRFFHVRYRRLRRQKSCSPRHH